MYSIEIQIYLEKYISHFQVIRDLFCVFTFHFFLHQIFSWQILFFCIKCYVSGYMINKYFPFFFYGVHS